MMSEQVYFLEDNHSYFGVETGLRYESVSGVAKKIIEPVVDWDSILINKAAKLGITPEELQAEWDLKREEGTRAGTAIHAREEEALFKDPFYFMDGDIFEVVKYEMDGDRKLQIQNVKPGHVYPELILSIVKDHMRVAGQADLPLIDSSNYLILRDFKTDVSIEYEGFRGQGLRKPFQNIQNCNYSTYSIKMSTYAYLLTQAHPWIKVGKIVLDYVPIERDENRLPIWGEDGMPIIKYREEIEVDYNKWKPVVEDVLNEYYKLSKKWNVKN